MKMNAKLPSMQRVKISYLGINDRNGAGPSSRIFWFDLFLYVSVSSYGHIKIVSSPNHTFSSASLTKRFTST